MSMGTVAQILVDVGSSVYCNTLIVVHSMTGTGHVRWYHGTTYDDWSFEGTLDAGHAVDDDYGTTVLFDYTGTARYWGIEVSGPQYLGTSIKIYEIFLGKNLELDSNPVYPYQAGDIKAVTLAETQKGVRHVYHNFDRKAWLLSYEAITDSDKDSIEEMVDYCGGSYKPLWFTLNPSEPVETHFIRFSTDKFTYNEIISGAWNVLIPFEQEL